MLTTLFDKITRLSIRFRWIVIALTFIFMAVGIYAATQLNLEMTPRVEFPQTIVIAQWPDADDANHFLEEVTIPLEAKLEAVQNVVNVESTTQPGMAFIIVRNEFGQNQEVIFEAIETAVNGTELPDTAETQLLNFSLSDLPITVSSISSSEMSLAELKEYVESEIVPELEMIEGVSKVTVGGGQELPDEAAETVPDAEPIEAEADTEPVEVEPTPEPGRLPALVSEGAAAMGIEVEFMQDVTPDVLAGITGTEEQIMAVLGLISEEDLIYAPADTLSYLPIEYMETLDANLVAELDELAAEFGGVSQYSLADVQLILSGEELPMEEEVVEEEIAEEIIADAPVAVPLPESWVEMAETAGFDLNSTADVTAEAMSGLTSFAPQLLDDLTPAMLLAFTPDVLAALPTDYLMGLDAETQAAIAALLTPPAQDDDVEPAEPVALPAEWVAGAEQMGQTITTTADITPIFMETISQMAPEMLDVLTPEMLLAFTPDVLAALPVEYLASLDADTQEAIAALLAPPAEGDMADMPQFETVELPVEWVAGAAQMGQTITTTADITPEFMGAISQMAPELLATLTAEMWIAFAPETTAVFLQSDLAATLDETLLLQLNAIQSAANGELPTAVDLPAAWVEMSTAAGFPMETTADIPVEAAGMLTSFPPEALADLTPEIILAMDPALLAAMPADILGTLDDDTQQAVTNSVIAAELYAMAEETTAEEVVEEPVEEIDPAVLPEMLIQGAAAAGIVIEVAQDLSPDFIRPIAGFGEQGVQMLAMLTDDHLRLMPAESIALLPADYLATLDADLVAELDELAADYGGAGELALTEAAEAEAAAEAAQEAAGEAPLLTGMWAVDSPEGDPPMFTDAYDLLSNSFVDGAAALLNFIPDSPNGDPQLMYDLTPEVMAYLAANEEGFVENLSIIILELMSPETLTYLLDEHPDAFDAERAEYLRSVALGDVDVFIPESSATRTNGSPSVILAVYKDGDANTVEAAHLIFDEFDAFTAANTDVNVHIVFEQATFIEDSIAGVSRDGALGGVFAILIILIFLSGRVGGKYKLSWRATLVTAVSIPLSIFSAFFFMWIIPPTMGTWMESAVAATNNGLIIYISRLFPTNITLNIMTLSGLTVAIGRVVDDSIVVLENSYRHIQNGDDLDEAIIAGTKEVAVAIFSATVTTMVVFLPLGLVGGLIGSFFLPFGLTVTYALMASFVVSITAVPALMSLLISKENIPEEKETAMQRWYTPMLEWSLNHRGIVMGISTVIFLSSLYLLVQLPQSFIPGFGEPTINVVIAMPNGTKMVETNGYAEELEAILADIEGIETVQTEIGSGGGMEALLGSSAVNQNVGNIIVTIEDQDNLDTLTKKVRQESIAVFGEDQVVVSSGSQDAGLSSFGIIITSDSLDELIEIAPEIKEVLAAIDSDGDGHPDIANVSSTVDALLDGNGGDAIMRIDGRPAVSFGGELETADTLGVTGAAKQAVLDMNSIPATVVVSEGFDSQQQVDGFQSMIKAIGISIILVYIIMALSFRSLLLPFTILFSLPFALVGAALALYLTNSNLGISAMIGFMMLVGVVVTNGIVLMELVKQLREKGDVTYDALVNAGRTRLRPIWMTALTAILALVPLATSKEAGAIIAAELGKAVMGGLIVGTALTLIIVPVMYSFLDQVGDKIREKSA